MNLFLGNYGPAPHSENSNAVTRRSFLKATAITAAVAFVPLLDAQTDTGATTGLTSQRLASGWEFFRGSLGGVWDVWRGDKAESTVWKPVEIPHCYNAEDAVDPDQPYYEGPAWYRRKLQIRNPFAGGRALLFFEGAGQKSQTFVGLERVGEHVGGYDEFLLDITDAANKLSATHSPTGEIPLAVWCDNSRDLETIPSDLNDFHRYGGLYRNVTFLYVPAISLQQVHIAVDLSATNPAQISIRATLHNPLLLHEEVQVALKVFDPKGALPLGRANGRLRLSD